MTKSYVLFINLKLYTSKTNKKQSGELISACILSIISFLET